MCWDIMHAFLSPQLPSDIASTDMQYTTVVGPDPLVPEALLFALWFVTDINDRKGI